MILDPKYEEKYKKILFDKTYILIDQTREIIKAIDTFADSAGVWMKGEYDNIGITYNNKIVELSNKIPITSFIGTSVIKDLTDSLCDGVDTLKDISQLLQGIINRKKQQLIEIQKLNFFQRILAKLKIFLTAADVDYDLPEATIEDVNNINSKNGKFYDLNELILNYDLKDNLATSIEKMLRNYSMEETKKILEKDIVPELQELGLINLLPEIQQHLNIKSEENKHQEKQKEDNEISL